MKSNTSTEPPPGYDEMLNGIIGLAENLRGIQELGVAQYTPVVERIIRTRSRDTQHIQHTLDYLLDFACHPAGLVLFKSLCRHYYTLDPAATVEYINIYREMWDNEDEDEDEEAEVKP